MNLVIFNYFHFGNCSVTEEISATTIVKIA